MAIQRLARLRSACALLLATLVWTAPAQAGTSGGSTFVVGPGVTRREAAVVARVVEQVDRNYPACSIFRQAKGVTLSTGSPSAGLLNALGVLRRPVTASDRLPAPLRQVLRGSGARGVYVAYVRLARVAFGRSYYLVPAANIDYSPPLPRRCRRVYVRELRRDTESASTGLRRKARRLVLGLLAAREKAAHGPPHEGVSFLTSLTRAPAGSAAAPQGTPPRSSAGKLGSAWSGASGDRSSAAHSFPMVSPRWSSRSERRLRTVVAPGATRPRTRSSATFSSSARPAAPRTRASSCAGATPKAGSFAQSTCGVPKRPAVPGEADVAVVAAPVARLFRHDRRVLWSASSKQQIAT